MNLWLARWFATVLALVATSHGVRGAAFSWTESGAGLAVSIVTNSGPVIYTAVRVELARLRKDLSLTTTLASNTVVGLENLSAQVNALPRELGTPVAAMNADFFMMSGSAKGDPRGLHIFRGELVSAPVGPAAFWQDLDGRLHGEPVTSRLTISWPGGGTHRAGLNEQLETNALALFTPRLGVLYPPTNARPATTSRTNTIAPRTNLTTRPPPRTNSPVRTVFNSPSSTNASSTRSSNVETNPIPKGGPIRPPGGREWTLEHAGTGPWLPLRVGQTYEARVVAVADGFTNVPDGKMILSLGSNLIATLPAATNGLPVTITVATEPDLSGVQTGLGTGPMLVLGGRPHEVKARMSEVLNPRSALGWDDSYLYLATADGRQPAVSVGIKLSEMADFMIELGCQEVINMDGGQSTTLMLNGQVINHPSDGANSSKTGPPKPGREHEVANGIVVLRKRVVEEDAADQ